MPKWMQAIDKFGGRKGSRNGRASLRSQPEESGLDDRSRRRDRASGHPDRRGDRSSRRLHRARLAQHPCPVAIYFVLGDRAAAILGNLKDWMAANNATIMTVLLLVLGAKLLGDGIAGLN
jgi:hypothetical protein